MLVLLGSLALALGCEFERKLDRRGPSKALEKRELFGSDENTSRRQIVLLGVQDMKEWDERSSERIREGCVDLGANRGC